MPKFRYKYLKQYAFSKNPCLVYRTDISDKHTHVASVNVAKNLIKILKEGYKPSSLYLDRSAKKLLTEDEYKRLRVYRKKDKYYNVGVKRCMSTR